MFAEVDVVLGGLDNREARLYVNQCCWKTGTPWIDGAIEGLMGTMRVFVPPDSACYECTMSERDHELIARPQGVLAAHPRADARGQGADDGDLGEHRRRDAGPGGGQAAAPDRLTTDFAGRGVAYNGLTHDSYTVTYPRREDCLSHDTYDLDGAMGRRARRPSGELLAIARERLGDAAVLDFEREIATYATCPGCGGREAACSGRWTGSPSATRCARTAAASARSTLDARRSAHDDDELLALHAGGARAAPVRRRIGARNGEVRVHFLLGGALDSLRQLGTA